MRFRVSEEELAMLKKRMQLAGTKNREAFLRKMALDGYVVNLDIPELAEMTSLLHRSSNNLNQLARHVNETGRLYESEIFKPQQSFDRLWECAQGILRSLASIQ